MKLMRETPVVGPSVIEKIRSTRFSGRWMISGSTRGGEFAVAAIDFDDALDVGLDLGAGEDRARLDLDFLGEVLVGNLAVALEHHLVDDRIFGHMDGQGAGGGSNLVVTLENSPVA